MNLKAYLDYWEQNIQTASCMLTYGKVLRISGFLVEGVGLKVPVGSICTIKGAKPILAEVIGFSDEATFFIAFEEPLGILPGSRICFVDEVFKVPVGVELKGRVLNGFGVPIDGKGGLIGCMNYPVSGKVINPFQRPRITEKLDVGVQAINSIMTVGLGQRMGIFAGSGVGKSVLLGMITRFTTADIVIVGLIGERSREINEFLAESIGPDYLHKTVVIAAPINTSPLERANGILTAVSVAEYFRDKGLKVLLIIDSLTRYAQALRKMYVLLGEPSTKGYPPSVFAKLSQLAERCGNGDAALGGSISAFFTVLIEADDMNDPVADHVRSILDGHIVLSRQLAEASHYPAIDVCKSISRVMPNIVEKDHLDCSMYFKQVYSHYLQNQDLIKIGMYKPGSDQLLDEGIRLMSSLNTFLKQDYMEGISLETSIDALKMLFKPHD